MKISTYKLVGFLHNCRVRPSKNFLGVLGRATTRLGIRNKKSLFHRLVNKTYNRKVCLDDATVLPPAK